MTTRRRQRTTRPHSHADDFDDAQDFDPADVTDRGEDAESDFVTTRRLSAAYFRIEQFAQDNIELVSEYADYRVAGHPPEQSFCRVFGTDYADLWLTARIEALEHNMVYRKIFAARFGHMTYDQMWDKKVSAYELKLLINNPFTKCSTRLSAVKELNMLYGITVIDDKGVSRPGKGLAEFYDDAKKPVPVTSPTGDVNQLRHPEPGSEEAKAFVAHRDARIAAEGGAE